MTVVQRLVLIVLLVAIPIALLQAFTVGEEEAENRAEAAQVALRTAQRAATEQQRIGEGVWQLLSALSQIPAVRDGDRTRCDLIMRRLQNQFQTYIAIGVAKPDGQIWCSSTKVNLNVSDRAYFRQALATRAFTTGGYVVGRIRNTPSLNFSLPFLDEAGNVAGVIIAGLDLNRLAADLRRAQLPPASKLAIIGPDRRVLIELPAGGHAGQPMPPHMQRLFKARAADATENAWLDGGTRLIGFVPPDERRGMPFLVAVGIDRAEALGPAEARATRASFLLALTIAVAVLTAWWFATRAVRRPIDKLAQTMRTWSGGDVTARVGPLQPGSEFNDLARAFDAMAEEVEAKQTRLFSTFESTSDIVIQIASDWTVSFMNERARARLSDVDLLGKRLWNVFPDVPQTPIGEALTEAMEHRLPVTVAYHFPPYGHFETYIFPDPEEGLTLFIRDMTERHQAQERLRELALTDALTGLPNRAHAIEIASQKMAEGRLRAIALIDLDGFKHINDRFGHPAGDQILQNVAVRLTSFVSDRGLVARLGGDEFLVLLYDADSAQPSGTAGALLENLGSEPFAVAGRHHVITASCGLVSVDPTAPPTLDPVLANADLALYRAKATGGATWHIYSPADRNAYEARLELEEELALATARGEFVLHYQPQIRLADGELTGAEALLRWRHPHRGLLQPGAFIDVLEISRHARTVGDWVMEEACRQAASWWRAGYQLRVAVNLFADQLSADDLAATIGKALSDHGLPARALELELTESIALDADERTRARLMALRALGVQLAFDDFGTGFASLTTLKDFPIQRLKVDRSFVAQLPRNEHDKAIVEAVLALARPLDLDVIAEGIETAEQEDYLRARGCQEGQGYRFGKPMPAEEFTAMLLRGRDRAAG